MNAKNLRERIAASGGSDQGEILEAASLCFLPPPSQKTHETYWKWLAQYSRFTELMTAKAHESAALLIADAVLPGWEVTSEPTFAAITDEDNYAASIGTGPTRALAIIDAVCAAKEKDETNG